MISAYSTNSLAAIAIVYGIFYATFYTIVPPIFQTIPIFLKPQPSKPIQSPGHPGPIQDDLNPGRSSHHKAVSRQVFHLPAQPFVKTQHIMACPDRGGSSLQPETAQHDSQDTRVHKHGYQRYDQKIHENAV